MSQGASAVASSIDFGHDIPEVYAKHKGLYFQSLPGIKLFFMDLTNVGSLAYSWTEETGSKGSAESLHCWFAAITEFCIGAGHAIFSLDTAGHLFNQHYVFLCHYLTSRFSPIQM